MPDLPPGLHLCGRQAGEHAARAGAGQLILTHLDPDNDPALNLAGAASAFGGLVSLATPGAGRPGISCIRAGPGRLCT